MIDIHNHIIVDADDGPQNVSAAIELLKQAKSEGVIDIVATAHHLHRRYSNDIQRVKEKLKDLSEKEEIKQLGLNFYAGQEIRVSDRIINDIQNGNIEGINN